MSNYTERVNRIGMQMARKQDLEERLKRLTCEVRDLNNKYEIMLEAQKLLGAVSDTNTTRVLDYITGVINKVLGEIFPYDKKRILLENSLYNGQKPHINVKLQTADGEQRDLKLQTGTGLRQLVSFLFTLCLIEVHKGRKLFVMDEILSGLHAEAKRAIEDIIRIFGEAGFQFIMVEYGLDDIGCKYLVEKPGKTAMVTPFSGRYNGEIFLEHMPDAE